MRMLINTLDSKITAMKALRQKEERRDNKTAQDAIDHKYSVLTEELDHLIIALKYTKENMLFQLSNQVLDDIKSLLLIHQGAVQSGYADKDTVIQVETDIKSIQTNIKKEWAKKYTNLTYATISTLKVIADIDEDNVSECIEGIERGENWTTNIDEFQAMNISLSNANSLISGLGLDEEIISFLQKMNSGKASVVDLDDKVMGWLKKESLDKKVKLSFR